jgi:hypothetical protein
MKKFREKINGNTFFVCSTHKDRFVHDTIKGWRRPPNQKNKKTNPFDFSKIIMPMVDRVFAKLSIEDFIGTQPLCRPREENKS